MAGEWGNWIALWALINLFLIPCLATISVLVLIRLFRTAPLAKVRPRKKYRIWKKFWLLNTKCFTGLLVSVLVVLWLYFSLKLQLQHHMLDKAYYSRALSSCCYCSCCCQLSDLNGLINFLFSYKTAILNLYYVLRCRQEYEHNFKIASKSNFLLATQFRVKVAIAK